MSKMLQIDYGRKDSTHYEYRPGRALVGRSDVSIDVGTRHFAVYVEDEKGCCFSGLWDIGEKFTPQAQKNLTANLRTLDDLLSKKSRMFIETQRSQNYMAVKAEQHVKSYFEILYPTIEVVNIPPTLKYKEFSGPSGESATIRKRWAITKALELNAADAGFCQFIRDAEKGDDLSDSYIQLRAWKRKKKEL